MANSTHDEDELQNLLDEQTQELMMAKTLASDIDLAFELQMQEAVNSSLGSQTPVSPPYAVISSDEEKDGGFLGLAATLMLEEVHRLPQEFKDLELCQAEMTKMREDLDRRVFDQTFARDILNIPEYQWEKYGDNYHRPYYVDGQSSSSSSTWSPSLAAECFKVYCKGLVSEEWVKDKRVKVAGLGVAICDSRDFLIFEVKKPLEVFENGGVLLSNACAELRAMAEGLDTAFNLGLHRVTFSSDDHMLYQYVTGRVLPSQHDRFVGLLDQISHLQRKFVYCEPSLVERNRVRYAFKSAREAIVSQIKWSAESDKGKSFKETCAICFEDTDIEKMFSVNHCLHRYCCSCMKQHVEVKLLNGMMAECPREGCRSDVTVDSCNRFLAPELVEAVNERIKESAIPVTEKFYCPFPRCSALMSKHEVLEYTKTTYVGAEECGVRKCMKCHRFFCINCKVPWHNNMTCSGYKNSYNFRQAEDSKLKYLASKKLWRQCVKCNHIIELAGGCYHITCRCGYEFCYTCGAKWENKKATCSCLIWDERNIIRNQRGRR
ncbi:hypothetical protein QN277_003027 [Acacia crassicarpa]|uniref:RBR-type E3 ubiquitin transferase n=1 Tax=Acacia crassicarpa TaxID=499986 RepID=A0AAE1TIP0_9FABA|nr:hypothetical protein QN277_003027 [Acacia crassicarpa]